LGQSAIQNDNFPGCVGLDRDSLESRAWADLLTPNGGEWFRAGSENACAPRAGARVLGAYRSSSRMMTIRNMAATVLRMRIAMR
jgi:hypothetical protein